MAAAGVFYAQQVEGGLDSAVLAAAPVQGHKDDIGHAAELKHPVSEHGVRPELTRGADSLQIRRGLLDTCAAQGGRVIEDTVQLSGVVLQAEEHIAEHDPVSQLHES